MRFSSGSGFGFVTTSISRRALSTSNSGELQPVKISSGSHGEVSLTEHAKSNPSRPDADNRESTRTREYRLRANNSRALATFDTQSTVTPSLPRYARIASDKHS